MDQRNMANYSPSSSSASAGLIGNVDDASDSSLNNGAMQALIGMMEYLSTDGTQIEPMTPPATNMKLESFSSGTSFCGLGGSSNSCYPSGTIPPYDNSSKVHPANVSDDEKLSANGPVSPASSTGYVGGNQHNDDLEDTKQQAVIVLRGHLVRVL